MFHQALLSSTLEKLLQEKETTKSIAYLESPTSCCDQVIPADNISVPFMKMIASFLIHEHFAIFWHMPDLVIICRDVQKATLLKLHRWITRLIPTAINTGTNVTISVEFARTDGHVVEQHGRELATFLMDDAVSDVTSSRVEVTQDGWKGGSKGS